MKRFYKSIRWQMQIWYGLLLLGLIVPFGLIASLLMWQDMLEEVDEEIRARQGLIFAELRRITLEQPRLGALFQLSLARDEAAMTRIILQRLKAGNVDLSPEFQSAFSGNGPGSAYFTLFDLNGDVILASANAPPPHRVPPVPTERVTREIQTKDNVRIQAVAEPSGFRVSIGNDITAEKERMQRTILQIVTAGAVTWLMALVGGWLIAGHVLRPIHTISESAMRIASGNLSERIPLSASGNELNDLASVLNQTFGRIHDALERQRQFTADASHELRTPVAVILSETQRMQKKPRSPEEYSTANDRCRAAGLRMRALVENLLLLARQDIDTLAAPRAPREPVALDQVVREVIAPLNVLAAKKAIAIHTDLSPITILSEAEKLLVLLNNIIGNAVSHHDGSGNVWVTCGQTDAGANIHVRDDGPGISERDLPHIFDRFYRAEKSRASEDMHMGLGLSVSQSIARELGGCIEVTSKLGRGTEFRISLPVKESTA